MLSAQGEDRRPRTVGLLWSQTDSVAPDLSPKEPPLKALLLGLVRPTRTMEAENRPMATTCDLTAGSRMMSSWAMSAWDSPSAKRSGRPPRGASTRRTLLGGQVRRVLELVDYVGARPAPRRGGAGRSERRALDRDPTVTAPEGTQAHDGPMSTCSTGCTSATATPAAGQGRQLFTIYELGRDLSIDPGGVRRGPMYVVRRSPGGSRGKQSPGSCEGAYLVSQLPTSSATACSRTRALGLGSCRGAPRWSPSRKRPEFVASTSVKDLTEPSPGEPNSSCRSPLAERLRSVAYMHRRYCAAGRVGDARTHRGPPAPRDGGASFRPTRRLQE